jgi:nucleoside-diphosphate-sugar epimerase
MPESSQRPVVIAGGRGKIALLLARMLVTAGTPVRGLIRNPDHAPDLVAIGAEPALVDLERDDPRLGSFVDGAAAVVFAAGAGPGSGAPRKLTMDRDGAIRLIAACRQTGVRRYVMISAMGAREEIPSGEDVFTVYLRAKRAADLALADSGLDYTIVRPGSLTDDPPTGHVTLAAALSSGSIPRGDVAATLVAVLGAENAIGQAFDLVSGPTPIAEAIANL